MAQPSGVTWRQVFAIIAATAAMATVHAAVVTPMIGSSARDAAQQEVERFETRHSRELQQTLQFLDQRFQALERQLDRIANSLDKG